MDIDKFTYIYDYKNQSDIYTKSEMAVLNFVSKAVENSMSVNDCDVVELKEYYSDAQIIEILFFISYMLTTNTIINSLNIETPKEL
ncbi:MAG: hypothetical protein ACK5NF_00610 [Bacilli bacterium]